MKTIVVGGGWAGLAAATTLSHQSIPVTLLESSKQLGGRARSIENNGWQIDNGQHLMLGAYRNTLALLKTLNIHERSVLKRNLFKLDMRSADGDNVRMQVPNVAAPMHMIWGLMRAKGIGMHERGTALRLGMRLARAKFTLEQDQPLEKWLLQNGQNRRLIKYLWEPLCLTTLNTPISKASTEVFIRLLKDSFSQERDDSDLLFILPKLNDCLPNYAQQYIQAHHGEIQYNQRVSNLIIEDNTIKGVIVNDQQIMADHVILATPPWTTAQLLATNPQTANIASSLRNLSYHPRCTIYLKYPTQIKLGNEMIGMIGSLGHWIFDRSINNQPGLMSVVICGPGKHLGMNHDSLAKTVASEISALFPHWPKALNWRVICEKRATFSCSVDINKTRPETTTPVKGLWLAGDYINTGYPSSLESAIISGVKCAKSVVNK